MVQSGVYIIKNITTSKCYIGSSIKIENRIRTHKRELKNNVHHSILLQRAYNLYGKDDFLFNIIEVVNDFNLLLDREQYWMDYYTSYNNNFGYNLSRKAGNCLGVKHSEETKKKLSLIRKGQNNWSKGRRLTPEHIAKLVASRKANPNIRPNKGRKLTEEHKAKIRLNSRRIFTAEHIEKIKQTKIRNGTNKISEETREKIRQTLLKRSLK